MVTVIVISIFIIIVVMAINGTNINKSKVQEKERGQGEIIVCHDEEQKRAHEWAMKMVEARKRKQEEKRKQREIEAKLAEEKKLAEIEKRNKHEQISRILQSLFFQAKESEKQDFSNKLKAIGADLIKVSNTVYYIAAGEDVNISDIFSLCNQLDLKYHIHIKSRNNNSLIEVICNDSSCCLVLEDDDKVEKVFKKGDFVKQAERFIYCYLENRKIKNQENALLSIMKDGINQVGKLPVIGNTAEERVYSALEGSFYNDIFSKKIDCSKVNDDMLIVDYELPSSSNLSDIKEYKYIASTKEISIKKHTDSYIAKRYEYLLYSVTLRTLYEIFSINTLTEINGIIFNGFVTQVNPAIGLMERKCIISIQADRNKFSRINLLKVEPKACFKALKGVSASKLIDISPITPILTFNKNDRRFVDAKDIYVNQGTNLAAMHWEDFEHLVRELFELEFARNGGEVRVTQASRDGGVDAVVFDPDPLRGGKIIIQAKRYTNTVGVSAVRDLYGTVINEGANSGILITTSDYGHDSYEFAKDKPLKLLNGGHLLALLHKNGRTAHINIEEAKKINEVNRT